MCLDDGLIRRYILEGVCKILRGEIAAMCSDQVESMLKSQDVDDLSTFTWDGVHSELEEHAPTLLQILHGCTTFRIPRPNQKAVIGLCAAVLCKYRRSSMSLFQKVMSLILYAGHSSKKVYRWFRHIACTCSS